MTSAKIIAHSISSVNGQEIITFELEYPRMVHSELMTHRLFSRNAASSRAIKVDRLIKLVEDNCALPAEWGLNKTGMQAEGTHSDPALCEEIWRRGAKRAIETARELQALGLHKQICNRPLEPFQFIKTIVTATSFDNWFWLRDHEAADPTIRQLAKMMQEALSRSKPMELHPGEYHLPYINCERLPSGEIQMSSNDLLLHLGEALKISTSCCAQVSYRNLNTSLEKAIEIYEMLVGMDRVHASPFEHIATPMSCPWSNITPIVGIMEPGEHMDHTGHLWSANFRGWYQHRQQIPNNTCWDLNEVES